MNVSEHQLRFIQEMKRRNFAKNTIDNYASCISHFFLQSKKDHPKNINEQDVNYPFAKDKWASDFVDS